MREGGFSLRSSLLAWITIPLFVIIAVDTFFLYRSALRQVNVAYDRTLLATAHAVGDAVRFERGDFAVSLPRALFEVYETDQSGRYFFRISAAGKLVAGDEELPPYQGAVPKRAAYPTVVQFYEDRLLTQPIRVAVLYQPVFSNDESGTVVIQVAEPMRIREDAASDMLRETLVRQGLLLAVVALAVYVAVTRALRPLSRLSADLDRHSIDDAAALPLRTDLVELKTVTLAINGLIARLGHLVSQQKRFIANAAHQLRTPLAVLKTQLQSGLRGDAPAPLVMREMSDTVERTIKLANQLLLLAKIEQRRNQAAADRCERCALDELAREAALELSPLIGEKELDFEIADCKAAVRGDAWLIGELIRNLLANAIQHTPRGQKLGIDIAPAGTRYRLRVWDTGGGLRASAGEDIFAPFASSFSGSGSGLGLAISREIVDLLGGTIALSNRVEDGAVGGLDACVELAADAAAS